MGRLNPGSPPISSFIGRLEVSAHTVFRGTPRPPTLKQRHQEALKTLLSIPASPPCTCCPWLNVHDAECTICKISYVVTNQSGHVIIIATLRRPPLYFDRSVPAAALLAQPFQIVESCHVVYRSCNAGNEVIRQ